MVVKALGINSYVFSKEIGAMQKDSVDERSTHWQLRSVTQRRSHHWPSSRDLWVRACNVWLLQCPSYRMNAVVNIGKQRLPNLPSQILTSSRTK